MCTDSAGWPTEPAKVPGFALGPSGRQKHCTRIPSVRVLPCFSVSQRAFRLLFMNDPG